jgi:hypothetical protein
MADTAIIPTEERTENDAVRAIIEHYLKPHTVSFMQPTEGGTVPMVLAPAGLRPVDLSEELDRYLVRPRRLKGKAILTTLQSFIDFADRYSQPNSALFASDDRSRPSITAVLNYNAEAADANVAGVAEFGDHVGHYDFPISDEWKAWKAKDGVAMSMGEFAVFLEERIVDVLNDGQDGGNERLRSYLTLTGARLASPTQLLTLSRGLKVHEQTKVAGAVNLDNGTGEVSFVSEHVDEQGDKLVIPNVFLVGLPVFRDGEGYRLAARLRYRRSGTGLTFSYELWRADIAFDDAFKGAVEKAQAATELPLFYGKPEA